MGLTDSFFLSSEESSDSFFLSSEASFHFIASFRLFLLSILRPKNLGLFGGVVRGETARFVALHSQFDVLCSTRAVSSLFPFFSGCLLVVVGSLYWARSRRQPSIFQSFSDYFESVPPG